MAGDLADPLFEDGQDGMNDGNLNYEQSRLVEITNNMPLVLCPYEDATYFEDLSDILRNDKEDFKRIVHAHLLSNGTKATGWELQWLKTAVKETMGFKNTDEVDKFVAQHFRIKTFKEFLDRANDIAVVSADDLIMPFLDDTNRDIFEDAVASSKNKDEKELRKHEQIAAKLELPENVEEFYRGINRVRQAVMNAYAKYESNTREGALAQISAMNGTTEKVIGVNFNLVCTEYKELFGANLTGEEAKKICGRSTLMKGLGQGKPQCLVDTIAMENKMEKDLEPGEKQGTYVALKTTSKEYSDAEIAAAVEACKQLHSQTHYKLNKKDYRGEGGGGRRTEQSSHNADMQRMLREQRERMAASQAARAAASSAPATAAAPAAPARARDLNRSDSSGQLDAIVSRTSTTNVGAEKGRRGSADAGGVDRYEGESSDDNDEQIYSDEEDCVERHVAVDDKKKQKQRRREQSSHEESAAYTSNPVHKRHTPEPTHPGSLHTPQPTNHPEVPYGQLPPAPIVLCYDDEKETIDELLENVASYTLDHHAAPSHSATGQGVKQRNAWEEEDEATAISQPAPELQQQRQPAAAAPTPAAPPANTSGMMIAPMTPGQVPTPAAIPPEAYQQHGMQQQPQPMAPLQQMQPPYDPMLQPQMMQQPQFAPPPQMAPGMMQGAFGGPPQQQQQPPYVQPLYPQQQPYPQGQFSQPGTSYVQSQSDFGGVTTQPQFLPPGPPMTPHMQPPPGPYPPPPPSQQGDPYYYQQQQQHQPQYPPGGYGPSTGAYGGQPHTPVVNVVVNHQPHPDHPRQTPVRESYPPSLAPPSTPIYVYPPSQGSGYQPLASPHVYAVPQQLRGPAASPQGQDGFQRGGGRLQSEHHWDPSDSRRDSVHDRGSSQYQQEPPRETLAARRMPPHEVRRDELPMRRGAEPVYDERTRRPPSPGQRLPHHHFPSSSPAPPMRQPRASYREPSPNGYQGFCSQNVEREERRRREQRAVEMERMAGGQARVAPRQERGFGEEERRDRGRGGEQHDRHGGQERAFEMEMERVGGTRAAPRQERGFGEEERRDRGRGGELHDRHEAAHGAERRRREPPIGRPQAASTPVNQSRELVGGSNLWRAFDQINTSKRRIRWQIVCILKNMLDKNRERQRRGEKAYEMIEAEPDLLQLVTMGCGNEMELYHAIEPYMSEDDTIKPFREFLRAMQRDGLVRLYSTTRRKGSTNAYEEIVFVTDPFMEPPANYGMNRFH